MNINRDATIGAIAATHPSAIPVFERFGIDFCCGGKRRLAAVCSEQGLAIDQVAQAIDAATAEAPPEKARTWSEASIPELIDHIVSTYHDRLREELPRLEALSAKVVHAHGTRAPYLHEIAALISALAVDLRLHMRKEEDVLFPALRNVARGARTGMSMHTPIIAMESDHDRAGDILAELRQLTGSYAAPDWGCQSFRALYHMLSHLESAMHAHVHLENNVLFPRALAADSSDYIENHP